MPFMKCGHAANGTKGVGSKEPVCAICYGIIPGADQVDENPPALQGRVSRCGSCGKTTPSSESLPFFEFRGEGSPQALNSCKHCGYHKVAHAPGKMHSTNVCDHFEPKGAWEFDLHYDGCRGWD